MERESLRPSTRRMRVGGKPGYCQITVCTGTAPTPRDQWVRWQWAEDDVLQLQFGLNHDAVREAGVCE